MEGIIIGHYASQLKSNDKSNKRESGQPRVQSIDSLNLAFFPETWPNVSCPALPDNQYREG